MNMGNITLKETGSGAAISMSRLGQTLSLLLGGYQLHQKHEFSDILSKGKVVLGY